jgi:hypothetical protein
MLTRAREAFREGFATLPEAPPAENAHERSRLDEALLKATAAALPSCRSGTRLRRRAREWRREVVMRGASPDRVGVPLAAAAVVVVGVGLGIRALRCDCADPPESVECVANAHCRSAVVARGDEVTPRRCAYARAPSGHPYGLTPAPPRACVPTASSR